MRWRAALWVGFFVQLVGMLLDARWHAAHPGDFETVATMLRVHAGIYLGVLITTAVALALAMLTARRQVRQPWFESLVLVGSVGQVIGVLWDGYAHTQHAASMTVAHGLIRGGLLFVAAGLILAFVPSARPAA